MTPARCRPVAPPRRLLLLLTLLALCSCLCGSAAGGSPCDSATICGMGICNKIPVLAQYRCQCSADWLQAIDDFPNSPCIIPNCTFNPRCLNLSSELTRDPSDFDVCVLVKCGHGGTCKSTGMFSYTCECQPGYVNMNNNNIFPCLANNCVDGLHCSAMGFVPPSIPPPPSLLPPPASPGNHDSSGAPAAPQSTPKGSVSLHNLLQLLLLVSLAMVQVL